LQTLVETGHDRIFVGRNLSPIDARFIDENSEVAGPPYLLDDLCRVEQRLGWNAPAVQAGSTYLVALDETNSKAELSSPQGRRVAGVAATQYRNVIVFGHRPESNFVYPLGLPTGVYPLGFADRCLSARVCRPVR
jgi:hypothetical protein